MLKGFLYTAISKYSNVILGLIISAVLARLLTPEEFGTLALVTVFISFFNLLGDMGIGPAIVQRKELTDRDLSSIFGFTVIMGFLLSIIFFLSAPYISDFYKEPALIPLVKLLSLVIFFNVIRIVPSALNRKKLRFKEMAIVSVSIRVVTGTIAIIMAFKGFSYYSLVTQSILNGIFGFGIFFYLYPVKFTLFIKSGPLKKIASFSGFQFAFNFINYFSRNLDTILIGKFLGNAPLGYYNKSYSLMMLPVSNLTHVISPVLHPVLAKHQDDKEYIFKTYLRLLKLLALIGFPISVFLYYASPELIFIMFGEQWGKSIPVFQILAFTVGLQICLSSTGGIFQAINRTDLLFISGLLSAVLMVSAICYGVLIGESLESIGYGLLIAFFINFFQGFYMLFVLGLKQNFKLFLKILFLPLSGAIILGIILYAYSFFQIESRVINLIIKAIIFGVVMLLLIIGSKSTKEMVLLILKRKK